MAYTKVKTTAEIEAMRIGGKMLATVLQHLRGLRHTRYADQACGG